MKNVSVIIPAYNERNRIGVVLDRMPEELEDSVIVVDDGSTDGTADVVRKMGFKVISLEKNSGKMHACMEGIKHGKELCVFMDGDGQLDPVEIPKVINALRNVDMVVCQRRQRDMPIMRRVSNAYARIIANSITGMQLNDVLCGFRGIKRESFRKMSFEKSGYFLELEMILEASRRKLKVATVPVAVSYRTSSRMSVTESLELAVWLFGKFMKNIIYSL